jgi:peptidoglycan/LPS O-acetylase OafA/YrhL
MWAYNYYFSLNDINPVMMYLAQSRMITVTARLMLSWYMVHNFFIAYLLSTYETTGYNFTQLVSEHLFILVASFPAAVAMCVFVEKPCAKLLQRYLQHEAVEKKLG